MKFAILDDETFFQDKVKKVLAKAYPNDHIETFRSPQELLDSNKNFDLLLSDIDMGTENGIDFANAHPHEFPYVIFVSSQTSIPSNQKNVFGLVDKWKIEEELVKKVEEVLHVYMPKEPITVFQTLDGDIQIMDRFMYYVYVKDKKTYVVTDVEIRILNDYKEIAKKNPTCFYPINRNVLVNLDTIESIDPATYTIKMENGTTFKIGMLKWKKFHEAYRKASMQSLQRLMK